MSLTPNFREFVEFQAANPVRIGYEDAEEVRRLARMIKSGAPGVIVAQTPNGNVRYIFSNNDYKAAAAMLADVLRDITP